jgi:DNA-binding NarL/FixJ family response regulator
MGALSHSQLSWRQLDVLDLLARGHADAEIAARLSIALSSVEQAVSAILDRFGAQSRGELIARTWAARA